MPVEEGEVIFSLPSNRTADDPPAGDRVRKARVRLRLVVEDGAHVGLGREGADLHGEEPCGLPAGGNTHTG
jgi:hypothetical protein